MENIDKRAVAIGIAVVVIIVVVLVVLQNADKSQSPKVIHAQKQGTVGGIAEKHAMYGTHLRGKNACGAYGDVSNCPKYEHPTLVGEDRAIYAIHNGTIHDPRLKSRMCYYNPKLLCVDENAPETEYAWDNPKMATAEEGPGSELKMAYGYDMRKALIHGGAPCLL